MYTILFPIGNCTYVASNGTNKIYLKMLKVYTREHFAQQHSIDPNNRNTKSHGVFFTLVQYMAMCNLELVRSTCNFMLRIVQAMQKFSPVMTFYKLVS